jgi:SAM-dependent methyltransferase
MPFLGLMQDMHSSTKRDYVQRVVEFNKAKCAYISKKYGYDYWDGERQYGYGGYKYDGRWLSLAKKLASHFGLKSGDKVLDVGCGKGFLLYELLQAVDGISITGLDISNYAIENCKEEVSNNLILGKADELPFADNEFDAVISLGTLHNLPIDKLYNAISEIVRVSKTNRNYIMVESWRNEEERANLLYWQLTCESFFSTESWEWIFHHRGYTGDWDFIFFE